MLNSIFLMTAVAPKKFLFTDNYEYVSFCILLGHVIQFSRVSCFLIQKRSWVEIQALCCLQPNANDYLCMFSNSMQVLGNQSSRDLKLV